MKEGKLEGPVKIVGTGLIGSSIGLALTAAGVEVLLSDSSPAVLDLAVDFGAGRKFQEKDSPKLVIICTPPDVTAEIIRQQLIAHPEAVVTDVSSVKATILTSLQEAKIDISNYVGSHPMAGREQTGALAGRSDIFTGRPWVICAHPDSTTEAIEKVEALALVLEAAVLKMEAVEHDRAVALVSHTPQLVSSLLAARLAGAEPSDVFLAGQGLRDTTRIAASDPKLWLQILSANSAEVTAVLEGLQKDLDDTLQALKNLSKAGSLATIGRVLELGNVGVSRIPGKHGERAAKYAKVTVMIDDKPGELARLLTEIGEIGINLEDLTLEHATGAQVGLPELFVLEARQQELITALDQRGWKIVG